MHIIFFIYIFLFRGKKGGINVEPYLEEADENSYLFFLNDISSQF
jgi:hypothetical protein